MEIKAKLNKPYTSKQRADFVVFNNHNKGYEIRETADGLEAWGLTNEEQEQADLENKQKSVRAVRNSYLEQYVDPYQLVIRWNTLSQAEQEDLTNYRQYLLDYTKGDDWFEQNPMDFETWKQGNAVIEEME
jgi:hypothetical protein